ncbi:MAG TPA: hypothetical protein VHB77_22260 [Planctomycetaceae bacterium]|nr:hypothetical protein [Planctomycetaceae bacterium]
MGLWERLLCRLQQVSPGELACRGFEWLSQLSAELRAFVADSKPHNHTYTVAEDRLIPHRQLAVRVARLSRHYLQPHDSLLDVSSSKGFFVFDAAQRLGCERSLGIDIDPRCIDICRTLNGRFALADRAQFELLTLPELAARIDEFGGPFQTALVINSYQYMYCGSNLAPSVYRDHREIFRDLRQVCWGRVVFHNRLKFREVQPHAQARAIRDRKADSYHPAGIRAAAAEFFRITELPCWQRRPIWLLEPR